MDIEDKSAEMSFCGNCGKKLILNATFCAHCGAQIPRISDFSPEYKAGYDYIQQTTRFEPPLRFIDHFKGVILNPKAEFQTISKRPNLKQPFLLNFLIGLFSVVAYLFLLDKATITFTAGFFESLGTPLGSSELDFTEFGEIFSIYMMIFLPIIFVIQWLIFSAVLWIINMIFASNMPSTERTYKKMATIVGWAQFPLILLQILLIIIVVVFLSPGEIIYNSIFEIETIVSSTTTFPVIILLDVFDLMVFFWGVILVYFALNPQRSFGTNPAAICLVYGIVVFFLRFDWVLSLIISLL